MNTVWRNAAAVVLLVAAAAAAACGGKSTTGPSPDQPGPTDSTSGIAGFDISVYPGDAAMRAWLAPASPYAWVGYYLPAPCHRDSTWVHKFTVLRDMGWGVAPIYVGQQDWAQISAAVAAAATRSGELSGQLVTCSATLLTADQATADAQDAIGRMRADAFPDGSTIFLDVESVTTITPALKGYVRTWFDVVLHDARYTPGIYTSRQNAPTFYTEAMAAYAAAANTAAPPFWITASGNFSLTSPPTRVGVSYAAIWQGLLNTTQTWNAVTLNVDVNVAARRSPGAPGAP